MLIDYLPKFIQNIDEFKLLFTIQDDFVRKINTYIQQIKDDQYINTSSTQAIERYEKIVGIDNKDSVGLDSRRFSVLMKYNERLPYTLPILIQKLDAICGEKNYKINLDYNNYTLHFILSLKFKDVFLVVREMLEEIIPMNLILNLRLDYNTHQKLRNFTHKELAKIKHSKIKEYEFL